MLAAVQRQDPRLAEGETFQAQNQSGKMDVKVGAHCAFRSSLAADAT